MADSQPSYSQKDIAVIGMECYMPGSKDVLQFWEHLRCGDDLVTDIPSARKEQINWYAQDTHQGSECIPGAYLEDISSFDHSLYRIPYQDAVLMDPSQRLMLDTVRRMLEQAGYTGTRIEGTKTGVYLGYTGENTYIRLLEHADLLHMPAAKTGNEGALISGRISHYYDLQGPSYVIDTACSSSLTAIHLACLGIHSGECTMAIAGGVQVYPVPYRKQSIGIESPDHRTYSFDAKANGTGAGEGIGAVLLKPLLQAQKDGDQIHAVIKGSAANHDGTSAGISTPNPGAQCRVIQDAWNNAEIDPESITYIEAHGTGTKIGDPLEIEGIRLAFAPFTSRKNFCYVSSVKSNIGHLDAAAGIAGFLKAICCLKNRQLAPTCHFNRPNPMLELEESPVYFSDQMLPWRQTQGSRRCGISAFSLSGSNCHIVLEEYRPVTQKVRTQHPCLFLLSDNEPDRLHRALSQLQVQLEAYHEEALEDICYTSAVCRKHGSCRRAFVVDSVSELSEQIRYALMGEFKDLQDIHHTQIDLDQKAAAVIDDEMIAWETKLFELARLYEKGAVIAFDRLYPHGNKIKLPPAPVLSRICWPEPSKTNSVSADNEEDYVIQLFGKIFSVDVTVNHNFFELGGDSINAIEIISTINEKFDTELLMSDLLDNPDLGDFISVVKRKRPYIVPADTLLQEHTNTSATMPLSGIQRGIFIQEALDNTGQNYGMYSVITLKGRIDIGRFEQAVEQLIARHTMLRGTVSIENDKPVLSFSPAAPVRLQYLEHIEKSDEELLNLLDTPLNLFEGPMYRFLLVQKTPDSYCFYTAIHHLLVDGYSVSLLIDDLLSFYANGCAEPQQLESNMDYRQYVQEEISYQKSVQFKEDEAFWNHCYSTPLGYGFLPKIDCSEINHADIHAMPEYDLPEDASLGMQRLAKTMGVTEFIVMLTAYVLTLSHFTNSEDLVFGTVLNDRLHNKWNKVVGPMIKTLPLRIRIQSSARIHDLILLMHQTMNEAYRHKDFPLESLMKSLRLPYRAGRNPLFDTVFVYQSTDKSLYQYDLIEADVRYYEKNNDNFMLFMNAFKKPSGQFTITVNYASREIDIKTVDAFASCFQKTLAAVCKSPDAVISNVLGE